MDAETENTQSGRVCHDFSDRFRFIVGRLAGAFGKTAAARKQPPQTVSLGEEAGSRIKQITADGKYLYLLTTDDKTADKIIIFDTEKFRRVSAININ